MFGELISPVRFGRGFNSNFNFFYIDDKEEANLIAGNSHSNL